MIVCSTCRKEMARVRTGVLVLFGRHHAYAGDEFKCGSCGNATISTNIKLATMRDCEKLIGENS